MYVQLQNDWNGRNQVHLRGRATFGHDANGNPTASNATTYIYDAETRLVASNNGAALVYEPLGRLFQAASAIWGKTQYLYGGDTGTMPPLNVGCRRRRADRGGRRQLLKTALARGPVPRRHGSIIAVGDCWGNHININSYDEYVRKPVDHCPTAGPTLKSFYGYGLRLGVGSCSTIPRRSPDRW